MMRHQFTGLLATTSMVLVAFAGVAGAQQDVPFGPKNYEHDFQMFAPLELDLDNQPVDFKDARGGYFFSYDKLVWSISGERVAVGDPSIQREVPPIWQDRLSEFNNPISQLPYFLGYPDGFPIDPVTGRPINPDNGLPIQRAVFKNSLMDAVPNAPVALGDRYEFGYANGDTGWFMSVIDGPEQRQIQIFGLNGGSQTDTFPPGLRSPWGDVYIAFEYEQGLMHGFQDVVDGAIGTGRVSTSDLNGDGIADGDGFADDLDNDGQYGPDGFDTEDPAFIPDASPLGPLPVIVPGQLQAAFPVPDYDDLVELPTSFQSVTVRNVAQMTGVEFMAMHRFNTRNWMAKHSNNILELRYGARYLRFNDNFVVNAGGGVLGDSAWNTQIDNNIVGPQVELTWYNQRGRWTAMADGRFLFGYNTQNWDQVGFIGEDLLPGRFNHPLYLQTHSFQYGKTTDNFSPVAEMRLQASYQLARAVALKAGWTGTYIGSIRRASTAVKYRLPNMGFRDSGTQDTIANGLNLGIEFNY